MSTNSSKGDQPPASGGDDDPSNHGDDYGRQVPSGDGAVFVQGDEENGPHLAANTEPMVTDGGGDNTDGSQPGAKSLELANTANQAMSAAKRIVQDVGTSALGRVVPMFDDDFLLNVPSTTGATRAEFKKPTSHSMPDEQYHMLMNRLVLRYPEEDADCAELYGSHKALLNPGRDLNDEMLRFAMKYTKHNSLQSEVRDSIVLFDSNFGALDRFVEMSKSQRMRFIEKYLLTADKQYLVFPANYDGRQASSIDLQGCAHWFLVVVTDFEELFDPIEYTNTFNATVVFMNSSNRLGISQYKKIQSGIVAYLSELHELYHGEAKGVVVRSRRPAVPQQDNGHDCGFFTIQFFEYFFTNEEARDYMLNKARHRSVPYTIAYSQLNPVKVSLHKREEWREIVLGMVEPSIREQLREAIKVEGKTKVPYTAKKAKTESILLVKSAQARAVAPEIPRHIVTAQVLAKALEFAAASLSHSDVIF